MDIILAVLGSKIVLAIAILVGVDFATGVIAALRDGKFEWAELGGIFPKDVLASLLAVGAQIVGQAQGGALDAVTEGSTFAILLGTIGHSIAANIEEITGWPAKRYINQVTAWIIKWVRRR